VKAKLTIIAIIAGLFIGCQSMLQRPDRITKIKVQTDYGVQLAALVDTVTETATYRYKIKNISRVPRELEITHSALAGQKRVIKLRPQQTQEFNIDSKIKAVKVSPQVRLIRLKPYLILAPEDPKKQRLLISNYQVDLTFKVPENTRVLKSTVPFEAISPGLLQWKMDDIAVLPPVDLWYTVATERVDVSAETADETGRATITVTLANTGSSAVRNISLQTRIPTTLYLAVPDLSDGTFELQQDIVYIWHADVDRLAVNQAKTMRIVLDKINKTAPMKNLEVRVYNQQNELIAIASTTAATPFFGN
jgi:hypothetical protein